MNSFCKNCGATNLKIIDEDENSYKVKCLSCDSIFIEKKTKSQNNDLVLINEKFNALNKKVNEAINESSRDGENVYKITIDSVFEVVCDYGTSISCGTAFFITKNYLLTNSHIFNSNLNYSNNKKYYLRNKKTKLLELMNLVKNDPINDLALFKKEKFASSALILSKKDVKTGQKCYTIGNSLGEGLTIYDGIISDSKREVDGKQYILFNSTITNGNSGGPLLNENGEVIGVATLKNGNSVGMSYAIPINIILKFLKTAKII